MRTLNSPAFLVNQELQYGQWWDFTAKQDRQTFTGWVTAGANAGDDTVATPIFLTGARAIRITDAFAAISVNSGGIDANNTSAWALASLAGTAIATKTHTADVVVATSYNMGAIASGYLAANTGVTLAITNGTTADLNSSVVAVTIGYVPADSFMDGLKIVAPDGGSVTVSDGAKGILTITPSDASAGDNDEIYLCTDTEVVKYAAGKSFMGEANIQFTSASTTNVCFGFTDGVAADLLVDEGAGPKAGGDYVLIWTKDGGTQWYCGVNSNATETPTAFTLGSPLVTAGSSSYQKLTVACECLSSTRAKATFKVDGVCIGEVDFVYSSATEMQMVLGAKNGTTSAVSLLSDYIGYESVR
ncbi:MAG: hypothetical protein M0R22_04485 [Dehalococcoidia bacterium]|jgi:hypothetical protein|nr:hypothetical protein [Dehalococcoidia bacterium]